MTLDDAYVSMREAVRRGHEDDQARAEAEWREQQLCESIEAREAYWSELFAGMPQWIRDVRYDTGPG